MQSVRIGFIGCGGHGSFLQSLVRRVPGLELTAVCDVDKAKAAKSGSDFGVPEIYHTYQDMLEHTSAEVIAVVGSPQLHVNAGVEVLRSGRHLFVEKPLGVDLAACQRLADAADGGGQIVMTGYMWRYATPIARLKSIVQSASFGAPLSMHVRFLTPQPRFAIWDLEDPLAPCIIADGGHPIDIMMLLAGDVDSVEARLAEGDGGVTSISCLMQFSSGAIGTLQIGTCTSGVDLDFMVCSRKGYSAAVRDNMNSLSYAASDAVDYQRVPVVEGWRPAPLTVTDADHTGWTAELTELADCVRHHRQPANNMEAGLKVMRVSTAIKESYTTGRTVRVAGVNATSAMAS
jgi:myo-inositol 2-dehydrogenase/D-chiro-inositol 1-dehydrogenase